MYIIQCITLYNVECTVYNVQCIMYIVHPLHIMRQISHNIQTKMFFALYSLGCFIYYEPKHTIAKRKKAQTVSYYDYRPIISYNYKTRMNNTLQNYFWLTFKQQISGYWRFKKFQVRLDRCIPIVTNTSGSAYLDLHWGRLSG